MWFVPDRRHTGDIIMADSHPRQRRCLYNYFTLIFSTPMFLIFSFLNPPPPPPHSTSTPCLSTQASWIILLLPRSIEQANHRKQPVWAFQNTLSSLVILTKEKIMVAIVISELKSFSRLKIFHETDHWSLKSDILMYT